MSRPAVHCAACRAKSPPAVIRPGACGRDLCEPCRELALLLVLAIRLGLAPTE